MPGTIHLLVFRFSALGDVAMTVPVIRLLLKQYPELEVSFVSDPFMKPLFAGIERLHFIAADTRTEYRGLKGLFRLSRWLNKTIPFNMVIDLHNVLRTKLIRLFIPGKKKFRIDKGRDEKNELTRPVNKKLRPLKTGFQRYADVFAAAGFPVDLGGASFKDHDSFAPVNNLNTGTVLPQVVNHAEQRVTETDYIAGMHKNLQSGGQTTKRLVGIAPFARHLPKMYPLHKMIEVVRELSRDPDLTILLFGSKSEANTLAQWESTDNQVINMAGKLGFAEELNLISQLTVMLSMDSANMHLASIYAVPVVSIWGGTHPYLGFYGWGQNMDTAIQLDLPCRPSSVFGNKPCPVHGMQGCMEGIEPSMIIAKTKSVLNS